MQALPEYRMSFESISNGAPPIDLDKLGERSKLGGNPDWEQENETPNCPQCNREMTFVAQIDSISHDSDSNPHRVHFLSKEPRYMFGDVGMIYIFYCFDCSQAMAVTQCG